MDAGARGPTEPEEADGDAECAHESWRETFFGFEFVLFIELRFDYLVKVVEEWRDNEHCAEKDSHERQAFLAQVELVNSFEDDWKRLEPDIQEAINKGDVQIEEEYHRFFEIEGDGPDESDEHDLDVQVSRPSVSLLSM